MRNYLQWFFFQSMISKIIELKIRLYLPNNDCWLSLVFWAESRPFGLTELPFCSGVGDEGLVASFPSSLELFVDWWLFKLMWGYSNKYRKCKILHQNTVCIYIETLYSYFKKPTLISSWMGIPAWTIAECCIIIGRHRKFRGGCCPISTMTSLKAWQACDMKCKHSLTPSTTLWFSEILSAPV